jgi:hypothetical protein
LTAVPKFEIFVKVLGNDVARDAREGNIAIAPLSEGEVEFVVFHPRNAANVFLATSASHLSVKDQKDVQVGVGRLDAAQQPLRSTVFPPRTTPLA